MCRVTHHEYVVCALGRVSLCLAKKRYTCQTKRTQFARVVLQLILSCKHMAVSQVVWVDLLTRKEFEEGFGSHTAMFSGQSRVIRYFMNFERALARQKQVREWPFEGEWRYQC